MRRAVFWVRVGSLVWMTLGAGCAAKHESAAGAGAGCVKERTMTRVAKGPFDVKLTPQALHAELAGDASSMLGRLSIDKQFHGDLEGTSRGEMLSAGTATKGSAGYVAMERVTGTLHGKQGTFMLQHSGTMDRGAPSLTVAVVPDSGTGELAGLKGTMRIDVVEKKHFYVFEYEVRETR